MSTTAFASDARTGVTHTLHQAIGAHAQQIARGWTREPSIILLRRS